MSDAEFYELLRDTIALGVSVMNHDLAASRSQLRRQMAEIEAEIRYRELGRFALPVHKPEAVL